jgi:hypothetical protein
MNAVRERLEETNGSGRSEEAMSRLFELKSHTYKGDVATIIDLEKVCWLQIEKRPRQHYPHIMVRFVDGQEWHDLMMDPSAYQLVEAFRAHLAGRPPNKMENGYDVPDGLPKIREGGSPLAAALSSSAN